MEEYNSKVFGIIYRKIEEKREIVACMECKDFIDRCDSMPNNFEKCMFRCENKFCVDLTLDRQLQCCETCFRHTTKWISTEKFGRVHKRLLRYGKFVFLCEDCALNKIGDLIVCTWQLNNQYCDNMYCRHLENILCYCTDDHEDSYMAKAIFLIEKENKMLKKEIEILKNHIRYAPGGEGALEALQSFIKQHESKDSKI